MMQRYLPKIWLLMVLGLLAVLVWSQFVLPDVAATTFGFQNEVTGTMAKDAFLIFYLVLGTSINLLFFAIFKSEPDGLIIRISNLPRKEYWLQPERVARGIGKLRIMIAGVAVTVNLIWFLSVVFLIYVNTGHSSFSSGQFVLVCFVLVGALIAWCFHIAQDEAASQS